MAQCAGDNGFGSGILYANRIQRYEYRYFGAYLRNQEHEEINEEQNQERKIYDPKNETEDQNNQLNNRLDRRISEDSIKEEELRNNKKEENFENEL